MSQRHSALISSDSEYFQVCFSAVHYLKISEQRWFSSEQRWKRKFSELKISAETALFSSETELIQSWTALIFSETALKLEILRAKKSALNQSCFSADFLWNRADFLWNSAETPNFQSKKISAESELFQRWFSLKQSWFSLKQRWNTKFSEQKNQRWIRAVSALIFSDTALKNQKSRARKISYESEASIRPIWRMKGPLFCAQFCCFPNMIVLAPVSAFSDLLNYNCSAGLKE